MINKISLQFFKNKYELDNSNINELYDLIIQLGLKSFVSFEEYSSAMCFLVKKYITFNDYLHSNNLLQIFKLICLEEMRAYPNWYKYYSIKVYSKRAIKHYLDNPSKFWDTIYELLSCKEDEYIERLDSLIVDVLEFYKKEYTKYPEFLNSSLKTFVRYAKDRKPYSISAMAHIDELSTLIVTTDKEKVNNIYNSLQSKNLLVIEEILQDENISLNDSLMTKIKIEKEKEETFYCDNYLNDEEDQKKKILVIGGDKFIKNKNTIFSIGKTFNINKGQFEFVDDYDRIVREGERIVNKTQWNDKYIGIIFGSCPHSTTGNEGASSLITKCQTDEGFPLVIVCRQQNNAGKPKITATNFKDALREIVIQYKSK